MRTALQILSLSILASFSAAMSFAQTLGDYRSAASGNWGTVATWETYDGASWVPAAAVPPSSAPYANVTIRTGHTVVVEASPKYCANLTIESTARLYANTATTVNRYIRVYGSTVTTNGSFGGAGGGTDGLGLEFGSSVTLIGQSEIRPCRIRPAANAKNVTLTISQNVMLTYAGSTGTGGAGLYLMNSGNDSITVTLSASKQLRGVNRCYFSIGSSTASAYPITATINLNGDVLFPDTCNMALRVSPGYVCNLNVGQAFILGRTFTPSLAGDGTTNITVGNAGYIIVGGKGGTADFSNPTQTVTGGGNFEVPANATLVIGSADGISAMDPVGPIRTSMRSFTTGANYSYVGAVPQNTGDGLPSTVNNLTVDNATGVALSAPTTVNGTLTVTNGDLDLNGNTVTLGPAATLSETPGNTVTGTAGTITTTRTLNAPAGTNIAGLGVAITSLADLGSTVITRGHAVQTGGGNSSIKRYFDITPSNNTGLAATLAFKYDSTELNGITESNLILFKSTDNGSSWSQPGGTVDIVNRTITVNGIDAFSRWTAASSLAPLPVQLASFRGSRIGQGSVRLDWTTISELNNYGFFVQRKSENATEWVELNMQVIPGHGTTNEPQSYSFIDTQVSPGQWYYRLKQIDLDQSVHYSDPILVNTVTGIHESAPKLFTLKQNYPNPFNPTTKIKFSVDVTSSTRLDVFNLIGEKIATLYNDVAEAGRYYEVMMDGQNLPSGVYFYKLQSGATRELRKLILMK